MCRASDLRVRGPRFNIWSGHKLSFLLPLFQEEQLSVTALEQNAKMTNELVQHITAEESRKWVKRENVLSF